MIVKQLRNELSNKLRSCSFEEARFEADCIIADLLGVSNSMLGVIGALEVDDGKIKQAFDMVDRRLDGEPLQYILGKWEFYCFNFFVGKGVLIPRPETELIIDIAADFLKNRNNPNCLDLCSGSGCIGITVARLFGSADVTLLEKSEQAFEYLSRNIVLNNVSNVNAVNADLFDGPACLKESSFDIILSNPPYISSDVVPTLQRELQFEPAMALDGGTDGLDFYRAIAEKWLSCLKPDGMLAVEIGEDQGDRVSELFGRYFADVKVIKDFSGNDRVVVAKNKFLE